MKKLIFVAILAATITSCNSTATENALVAKADSIRIADSIMAANATVIEPIDTVSNLDSITPKNTTSTLEK